MDTVAPKRKLGNKWLIAFIVASAAFLETMDNSIGNVAIPHIAGNLSVTSSQSTWVLTSYIVANSVVLPLSGWLSRFFGRRNYFLTSIIGFTISSGLCGIAPNLGLLVFFRVLQGLFGGGLVTASQAILADTFDPSELSKAMAIYIIAILVGPIVGPLIGGWITDNTSWRWIFLINIPLGLISIVLVSMFVHDPPGYQRIDTSKGIGIDYIGIMLISLAIGAFQVVLDRGQEDDWFASPAILTLAIVSAISFITAVWWELKEKHPVVDIRLLGNRNVFCACAVMFVTGMIIFGSSSVVPMFVQRMMGYTATLSGWTQAPGGVMAAIMMVVMGTLTSKGYLRWYVTAGLIINAWSMYLMMVGNLNMDMRYIIISRIISGIGTSMVLMPATLAAFGFVSANKNDAVSGITSLFRNMGGSVGISMMTVIVDRRMQFHQATLVQHLTQFDQGYQQTLASTAHAVAPITGTAVSSTSMGLIYGTLQQQSMLLSYLDSFQFLVIASLIVIPLGLLIKTPKHSSSGSMMVH